MYWVLLNVRRVQAIKFKHHATPAMLYFFPGKMKQTDVVKITLFLCALTYLVSSYLLSHQLQKDYRPSGCFSSC